MDFDRHAAAWLRAQLMADGPVHDVAKKIDPHWALLTVKAVILVAPYVFPKDPSVAKDLTELAKEIAETLHQTQVMEPVLSQAEAALTGHVEAEQVKTEQVKAELDMAAEQVKAELDKAAEQVKAEMVKADAERAAAVIEEQTAIVEQEIVDEPGKSTAEREALEQEFEREKQRRETKLNDMERNYFEKHPELSKEERDEATKTFQGIKDKEMGNLSRERETRLEELTHAQEQHREELAERLEELEGTRAR